MRKYSGWLVAALLSGVQLCCSTSELQPVGRPNILLAIADDWSFGHAGAYGSPWVETPGFDRIAREGVLFTRAYTPNAKCAPSRATLLTGRQFWQLKEAANHWPYFPLEFRTYAEALGEHGYAVGVTGKGWAPGVALDAQGNPRRLTGEPFNLNKGVPPTSHISDNDYAANFEAFLDTVGPGQPWAFWYGALEPHRGYEYGSGVRAGKDPTQIEHVPAYWPDTEVVRNDLLDYAIEVEHFDRHLVHMLEALERRGLLENTLVVVTSDHGMPFPRVKGQAYDHSNRVPLAVMWRKGIRETGRVVEDFVSLIDLAPTFIELAGLEWAEAGMQTAAGRSLTDILYSESWGQVTSYRDFVLIGKERHDVGRPNDWGYAIRGLIEGDWLYLHNFETDRWPAGNPETGYLNTDGSPTKTEILEAGRRNREDVHWRLSFGKRPQEELYDLYRDPDCVENLAVRSQFGALQERLRERLFRELRAKGDPRVFGKGNVFDEFLYAGEAHRNFYQRFMRGEELRAGWVNETDFEPRPLD